MEEREKQYLIDFYRKNYETFGDSIQALAWYNRETQAKRFEIFTSFYDINDSSIIDIGSGLGDFWEYLKNHGYNVKYTGIDIVPDFVERAKNKYCGEADFFCMDLKEVKNNYDYVFASGTFNHKQKNNEKYIIKAINIMFNIAAKGVIFNLLSIYTTSNMKDNKMFYYYDPEKIVEYARKLTNKVLIKHDYLPNDFTIGFRKD